jgi:hypothetical protein
MSFSIDTNILLYSVDEQSPFHASAKKFLLDTLRSGDTLYLPWPVVYSFLRIATHSGIFAHPLSPVEALDNMTQLIEMNTVELLADTPASWNIYSILQHECKVRGNIVPDARIAALLEANGIRTLYTNDTDFRTFPFLRPVNPFS